MSEQYVSKACCTLPPLKSEYEAQGTFIELDGTRVYIASPAPEGNVEEAVLIFYDIFGFLPNVLQGADTFAKQLQASGRNALVVLPDFFHGAPYDVNNFPPKEGFGPVIQWINDNGNEEKITPTLNKVSAYLSSRGVKKVGTVGYCWGAKVCHLHCTK